MDYILDVRVATLNVYVDQLALERDGRVNQLTCLMRLYSSATPPLLLTLNLLICMRLLLRSGLQAASSEAWSLKYERYAMALASLVHPSWVSPQLQDV